MNLVIVESPAKAKTINKYLGKEFEVIASYGHIADLPSKNGSVEPDKDFAMHYEVDSSSVKQVKIIAEACKKANTVYLATDPDREGEAISWHIAEEMKKIKAITNQPIYRISFNQITKSSVKEALASPRDIDMNLVNAQQARRALDYLVGFSLSPILWRKLPGSRSAGRVQSVALRLICERELEIKNFVTQEYWQIKGVFFTSKKEELGASLVEFEGKKLEKFSIVNQQDAEKAVKLLMQQHYKVADIEEKAKQRKPQPPFNTASLQQEAARKLGFGAKRTMQIAQRLYEGVEINGEATGLITYMRTDGVQVAPEAIQETRAFIAKQFGDNYVPSSPNHYQTKAKNAQEAHEAIRPTNIMLTPDQARPFLSDEQLALYQLVWQRLIASQMANARLNTTSITIAADSGIGKFRATGSVITFPGFLALYQEGKDDTANEEEKLLPAVQISQDLDTNSINPSQHFTEPPPRYSEASLVKKLEELGIGRPSTYATIISVLQDRNYVKIDKKRFVPEDRGMLVTAFLTNFFKQYVEYDFTAHLEEQLDEVSAGNMQWKVMLRQFWDGFALAISSAGNLSITEVLAALQHSMAVYLFGPESAQEGNQQAIPHNCPTCKEGTLELRLGKFGAFIACNRYPECKHTRSLGDTDSEAGSETSLQEFPHLLGKDPATGLDVTVRKGPYGVYLQLGEEDKVAKTKPKRSPLPKGQSPAAITIEQALELLSLPRELGVHPETQEIIVSNIGQYGDYIKYKSKFYKIPSPATARTITLDEALELIAAPPKASSKAPKSAKATKGKKK